MVVISLGKWSRTLISFVRNFYEKKEQKEINFQEKTGFLEDISNAKKDLEIARNNYNFAENDAMLECCIYEIKAAETRLDYCIRQAKKAGVQREFMMLDAPGGERFF